MLRPQREAEVRRVDLAGTALDILAWGGDPRTFEWFERPPEHRLESAMELLRQLGAIEGRRLTPVGEQLRRIPLHPRLARVIVEAGGTDEAIRVCALLSEDRRGAGVGDALTLADDRRLDFAARELRRVVESALGRGERQAGRKPTAHGVQKALLAGYPDRVAWRREPGSARLLLSSGTGAQLAREAGLYDGEFLVALDVVGGQEALVRIASVVEREWLAPTHRDVVHTLTNGKVRATERVWYGAILLREINVAPDPGEVRRLRARELRANVDPLLERRLAFAGLEVDWDTVVEQYGGELPYEIRRKLDQLAPERLPLPSGRTATLDYRQDGSVVASVKLQELFGLADSPRLGPRQTPVTFALLSPAGRPVQVTRDLRSFWSSGYQEVRKELRARYPKHPWPDDPWTATPTHRTTRRS